MSETSTEIFRVWQTDDGSYQLQDHIGGAIHNMDDVLKLLRKRAEIERILTAWPTIIESASNLIDAVCPDYGTD